MTGLFSFDARTETPKDAERRRQLAALIMGRSTAPKNVGEGFGAIADGIVANVQNSRAGEAEQMGRSSADATRNQLMNLITGGSSPANANQPSGGTAMGSGGGNPGMGGRAATVPTGERAGYIRQGLVSRGLPEHVADAFLLNMQDESGMDPGINEASPIVPGSRGGYGLYQLTGPRRTAYEQFAGQRGVDPSDIDAQLDWLMYELQGPESKAAQSILGAPDMNSAAVAIVNDFLRPAPEHRESRASAYMAAQPQQVASLDPGFLQDIPMPNGNPDPGMMQQLPAGAGNIDPGILQNIPGVRGGQQTMPPGGQAATNPASGLFDPQMAMAGGMGTPPPGLPATAERGAIMRAADGQPYQYIQMDGDTSGNGNWGWARVNPGPGSPQETPNPNITQQPQAAQQGPQVAQAGGGAPMPQPGMAQPQRGAPGSDIPIQELMEMMSNPWLDEPTRAVIGQLLEQQMAPPPGPIEVGGVLLDPNTMQPIFDSRGPSVTNVDGNLIDNRTGQPIYSAPQQAPYEVIDGEVVYLNPQEQTATSAGTFGQPDATSAMQNYEYLVSQGMDPSMAMDRAFNSGVTVENNMPGPDAGANDFWGTLGSAATDRYVGLMENGNNAARTLSQLDQLQGLLDNTPQGFEAAATAFAGNFGIDLGNATGVQAAEALINQMVPAQRPPGSGPMSDADLELFKRSVPRLINQPGGNELIIQTMRDINNYDLQLARVVEDYSYRGQRAQSPQEADQLRDEMRQAIETLQNPLENFNERIEGYRRDAPASTSPQPNQSQANPDVVDWQDFFQ